MKRMFLIMMACMLTNLTYGQHRFFDKNIHTLQVTLNDNPLLPPILSLGKSSYLNISWDEMSHEYHRYIYRIQHCNQEWEETTELFESDFLHGNNDCPIEDYEYSFNTTQIYTHYAMTFPNRDTNVLVSGNYKLLVFEEDNMDDGPVIEVRFHVVEEAMGLSMQVSSNTDIDFNNSHQQVALNLNYGAIRVSDPYTQISAVVTQNRRPSRTITGIRPDINKSNGLEWKHCSKLIFPAGNEYYKFEILDVNLSGMNVDRMRWFEPFHHAILWEDKVPLTYATTEDRNGSFFPRTGDQENNDTQSEYVIVHFTLQSPRLQQKVYVNGLWSNGEFNEEYQMQYNDEYGLYEASVLMKQGYYDYQYITEDGATMLTMGDFWQTENEYQAFIYYKEIGGRYDRIVGYTRVNTRF